MKKGFTLIELIMTIIIAGIILIPTSVVVYESARNAFLPEYLTAVSSLLEAETERISNLRFANVINEGPTNFGGNFSDYSYQITVNYVNPGDLNTPVDPTVTDYKRVEIAISRLGFSDVSAVTLITNN